MSKVVERLAHLGSWQQALLLLCAVALLYGQFLWNPLVFDDTKFFTPDAQGHSHILSYAASFSLLQLRALPYATLAWTVQWFGPGLAGLRIGNLLLHAATVLALFFFLMQLFDAVLPRDATRPDGLSQRGIAFFAALLFGLHPVATYAVGYLVQRSIVMATLFSLLAMFSYVRGSVQQKQSWLWASVLFYYLAVYSKEHAIMLPAALLVLSILLHKDWLVQMKRQWLVYAAYGVIVFFLLWARKTVVGSTYEINAPQMLQQVSVDHTYLYSVLTQSWLFFKYWALWLFPNPAWMSVDMREPFADSFFSRYLLALLAFVLYGLLALRLLFKRGLPGLLGFALLFPWLMFMTEFSLVRVQEEFVLYRSYLWAVGACALLPLLVWKLTARGAILLLGILALAMFPISMERLSTFSHPFLLWDDAEKLVRGRSDLPGEYRIYYNRGTEYVKIDQIDKAIVDLKRSLELFPQQDAAFGNLGAAYLKKGEMGEAVVAFSQAIQISEKSGTPSPQYLYGRAVAHEAMKNWSAASEDYSMTCKLDRKGCDKTDPAELMQASQK